MSYWDTKKNAVHSLRPICFLYLKHEKLKYLRLSQVWTRNLIACCSRFPRYFVQGSTATLTISAAKRNSAPKVFAAPLGARLDCLAT